MLMWCRLVSMRTKRRVAAAQRASLSAASQSRVLALSGQPINGTFTAVPRAVRGKQENMPGSPFYGGAGSTGEGH